MSLGQGVASALLGLAVLAAWLAAAGMARLRDPLDRLHCVGFVNVAAGLPVLAAAALADGPTVRLAKIGLIVAVNLVSGAALAHALGRAVHLRQPGAGVP